MPIKVLIADDSSFQRNLISKMISEHPKIEVVGVAKDGLQVLEMVEKNRPNVLLLDILMPKMDGLSAFKLVRNKYSIPTIIFSVLDPKTMDASVQALLLGAFDYIIKPGGIWKVELPKFKEQLISKILLAYKSKNEKEHDENKVFAEKPEIKQETLLVEKNNVDFIEIKEDLKKVVPVPTSGKLAKLKFNIIVIGTSVGGPRTLKLILEQIPKDFSCPILIVQHLDNFFMKQFADSLSGLCKIYIKIAEDGEEIHPGIAYLSPGDKHMKIILKNNKPCLRTFEGKPINFCLPSIDPLFFSAARIFKNCAMGIILTGLGVDGVAGLEAIKLMGGKTIAESKETSVVYGMPKVAFEKGAAQIVVPNYQIKNYMINYAKKT